MAKILVSGATGFVGKRLIVNLVNNACRYGQPPIHIEISIDDELQPTKQVVTDETLTPEITSRQKYLTIKVSDEGQGVAEDQLSRQPRCEAFSFSSHSSRSFGESRHGTNWKGPVCESAGIPSEVFSMDFVFRSSGARRAPKRVN